ncbi:MAG: DUF6069 family protein [Thermomicrobiales bacterium]
MTTSPLTARLQGMVGGSVHLVRLATLVLAVLASAIVWVIADPLGGANLRATGMGGEDVVSIGLGEVFFGFLSWGIGAWVVVMLIERFTSRPKQIWLIIALIALLLSFIPVFASSDNGATTFIFIVMHVVSAAIIIPSFADTIRPKAT